MASSKPSPLELSRRPHQENQKDKMQTDRTDRCRNQDSPIAWRKYSEPAEQENSEKGPKETDDHIAWKTKAVPFRKEAK